MARILVTGASGFIGRNLIPKLRGIGSDVAEADSRRGHIADEASWSNLPQVEAVIHLAGRTFVPDSWADPVEFLKTNLLGTVAALNYCRKNDVRLVFLSSYLYGNPKTLPILESAPLHANNPYALSKMLAEEACKFYADTFGVKMTILRPFNVYGPGQPEHFLIPSIINQVRTGTEIRVKDLKPRRDYVYIDDLVDAIIKSVGLEDKYQVINIGTGTSYSVAELIEMIQEIKGTRLNVHTSGDVRVGEVMDTRAEISKATEILNWSPKWTLHDGLSSMLASA